MRWALLVGCLFAVLVVGYLGAALLIPRSHEGPTADTMTVTKTITLSQP